MPMTAEQHASIVANKTEMKKIQTQITAIVVKAKDEKRSLSAEEQTQFDKLENEFNRLNTECTNVEKLVQMEERSFIRQEEEEEKRRRLAATNPGSNPGNSNNTNNDPAAWEKRHVETMLSYLTTKTVAPAFMSEAEQRNLVVFDQSNGGALIAPEQFSANIIKKVDDMLFLLMKSATVELTGTRVLSIPELETDLDEHAWTTEIASIAENDTLRFRKRALTLNPLRSLVKASNTFLNTVQNMRIVSRDQNSGLQVNGSGLLENRIAYSMAKTKEANFMLGSGVGEPLGIFVASDRGIPVAQDVPLGAAITYPGLVDTKYKLKVQYQNVAEWFFHRDIMKIIMKLVDSQNRPLLNILTFPNQPTTLLERPVNLSEFAPNAITNGSYVGIFGDMSMFYHIYSPRLSIKIADQLFLGNDQVGFFSFHEADAAPVQSEAFSRMKISA